MSAPPPTSEPEPSTGMYALQVATLYAFGAFAFLAGVALLLQYVALSVNLDLGQMLEQASSGLMTDSHACLLGFLVLGSIRWNFGGLASLRRSHARAQERAEGKARRRGSDLSTEAAGSGVEVNPYAPSNWERSWAGHRLIALQPTRG